jgi:restriction system protein
MVAAEWQTADRLKASKRIDPWEERMTVWTVKGGAKGEAEEQCLKLGLVGKGAKISSLEGVTARDQIRQLWADAYPEMSAQQVGTHAAQLWSLIHRMQDGELVVLPLKTTGTIAVGRLSGHYQYRPDVGGPLTHARPVEWLKTDVERDAFDQDLLYSFGAFITIGKVRRDNAEERVLAAVSGVSHPSADDALDELDSVTAPDIPALAREQVRQHIAQTLTGHGFAHLVAAVLSARGLATSESPPGPDKGVDILAGSGPLGLDPPHLAVQVKKGTAGVEEFRALRGVMEQFRAQQGLLVAWGGLKGTVREEARQAHFSTRLWDAEDFLNEIFAVYEDLPGDIRSELPLQRVWSLVVPEE